MSSNGLHPSVERFKQFMREHPGLMKEIQLERKSLQDLYEEWSILGAEHEQWLEYKVQSGNDRTNETVHDRHSHTEEEGKQQSSEGLKQFMDIIKNVNVQDLQNHLGQFNSVLANVQNVLQSFQKSDTQERQQSEDRPFSFRRD